MAQQPYDPRHEGSSSSAHPAGRDSDNPWSIALQTRIEPAHQPSRHGIIP
ncbi:MAG: hypothetical protein KGS49_09840 [Planctomycetes bacterium]|nr:hypothetical protein [Planctomycetota bacterium]